MDDGAVKLGKHGLGRGPDGKALLERALAALGHPGHLGSEALDELTLLRKQGLRNQDRQVAVLHPVFLEAAVEGLLHVLPDCVPGGQVVHEALDLGVAHELRLLDDVRIPLGEVLLPGGDFLDQFLFLCHYILLI